MKIRLDGKVDVGEPATLFWLEVDEGGNLDLKCRLETKPEDVWYVLTIGTDGTLFLYDGVPEGLGFNLDRDGRIETGCA